MEKSYYGKEIHVNWIIQTSQALFSPFVFAGCQNNLFSRNTSYVLETDCRRYYHRHTWKWHGISSVNEHRESVSIQGDHCLSGKTWTCHGIWQLLGKCEETDQTSGRNLVRETCLLLTSRKYYTVKYDASKFNLGRTRNTAESRVISRTILRKS